MRSTALPRCVRSGGLVVGLDRFRLVGFGRGLGWAALCGLFVLWEDFGDVSSVLEGYVMSYDF